MEEISITPAQRIISSCTGSLLTSLLVTPFDVVKVRMQMQTASPAKQSCFIYCNGLMDHMCKVHPNGECLALPRGKPVPYAYPGQFGSSFGALSTIVRNEGMGSLWSGLSPTLLMAIPANVVYFTMYDTIKYKLGFREDDPSTKYIPVLAGTTARALSTTLVTPIELIRTIQQSKRMSYRELGGAVRSAVKEGGAISLLQGLGPTLLRDVPFSAVYWFTYEQLKAAQMEHPSVAPSLSQSFCAGAGAGALAALLTQPFDVIKTQCQISLGNADFEPKLKVSTLLSAKEICKAGWGTLYAGLFPRLMRIAPACAIMISSYEYGKAFFLEYNSVHHQSEH